MSKQRHLANAPIQEALIDIQFEPVEGLDVAAFSDEYAKSRSASVSDLFQTMFEIRVEQGKEPPHLATFPASDIGKRIDLIAARQVIQVRANGFTFSQLAPYETWDAMLKSAMEAWQFFSTKFGAGQLTRAAVRYVNVLHLPLPIESFDAYLTSAPKVPDELPQGVSSFLDRVVCPQGDDILTVTQSLEGQIGNAVKVILDIDVAHVCKMDRTDIDSIASVLERLRSRKNDAFFAYVEEKTLEMYE